MGGSTTTQSNTTTQQLTPEQQQLVSLATPQYEQFANSNITMPTGDQAVAPLNATQQQGEQQVLGQTGTQASTVGSAANTNQAISSGEFLDPGSNKYVTNAVNAATQPIFDNLNQVTLPQIGANASTGAGGVSANFGGSRQGIAEGLATKGADEAAGQAAAGIENNALTTGINATNTAIAQAPTTAASLDIPGSATSAVGSEQQTQAQNVLNANNQASMFAQLLPLLKGQALTQGAAGTPGGTTTSTGTTNNSANPISQLIGGASAAGGLAGGLSKLIPLLSAA